MERRHQGIFQVQANGELSDVNQGSQRFGDVPEPWSDENLVIAFPGHNRQLEHDLVRDTARTVGIVAMKSRRLTKQEGAKVHIASINSGTPGFG